MFRELGIVAFVICATYGTVLIAISQFEDIPLADVIAID